MHKCSKCNEGAIVAVKDGFKCDACGAIFRAKGEVVKSKNGVGAPTVMTDDVISKLEYAFSIGCTDIEACLHAGINKATLYNYQKKCPEFLERKEALKQNLVLKARTIMAAKIEDQHEIMQKRKENSETKLNAASLDITDTKWYLERKNKSEFATQSNSVAVNKNMNANVMVTPEEAKAINAAIDKAINDDNSD